MKKLLFLFTLTILVMGMAWADYSVNFEGSGEVKNAYASGTITLSGIDWNMTNIMTSTTSDADWYNGTRSARLRGHGDSSMSMLADKTNGLGIISFNYRRYGTDTQVDWKVEYSIDAGTTWIQIGSSFTAPASNDIQTFSQTVNVTGNVRIRILRATLSGTSNRRLNIDDILLTDYLGSTPSVASPIISPSTGNFYSQFNATISCSTENATIYYTTDGSDPNNTSIPYTAPIYISQTTTLKAIAYAEGYDPSPIATAIYTFPVITDVANIATLRNQPTGTNVYRLTGEAILTFQQDLYYHPKWVQVVDKAPILKSQNYLN